MTAERFALLAAGWFFLTGLLTGLWKYAAMSRSPDARAPHYVDTAHRASLLYAFACLLIERLLQVGRLDPQVAWWATVAQITFFALAVGVYLVHGALNDTRNQFERPHRLGRGHLPPILIHGFMVALVIAEVGGFIVVFAGALMGGGSP